MRRSHVDDEPVAIAPPGASRRADRRGSRGSCGRPADRRPAPPEARSDDRPDQGDGLLDGREPCSYLLDPLQNFVPEPLDFGHERELGRHALNFTLRDDEGCFVTEMVAMSDGGMFDLLASVW